MTDARQFRDDTLVVKQDWSAVSLWFAQQNHQFDWNNVRQYAGGVANMNYLALLDGVPVVFRCPPSGPLAKGANDLAREWRVLSRLNGGYALAPRAISFCGDAAVIGKPFLVIEHRDGVAIGGVLPSECPEDAPNRLTMELIGAMTALHRVDPASVDLDSLGRPEGFLERQLEGWLLRGEAAWQGSPPKELRHLGDRLRTSVPLSHRTSLLHMDFKLDNLLIDPVTLSIQAVIDWDMATRGCSLYDLAILLSYWVEPSDPQEVWGLAQIPSLAPGFMRRREVAERFFVMSGDEYRSLSWHLGCARLRLAVAWMQLALLWERGEVVGDRYKDFATLALSVLRWANDSIDTEII